MTFTIPGDPVGKGRPRFYRCGGSVRTYTPDKTKAYEEKTLFCFRAARGQRIPAPVPITVHIAAVYPVPKSTAKARTAAMLAGKILPTKKPDIDNICKCVLDALNGAAWDDDAQIVKLRAAKLYGPCASVSVTIEALT